MRIGIIGTGLIGGSLALALKRAGKHKVYCYNRRIENSKKALKIKAVDEYFESIEELAENCDVMIIATPLGSYTHIGKILAKYLDGKKIISDVGSVKSEPTIKIQAVLPAKYKSFFVPAHPIAGKEKGGLVNADANLYKGKKLIITKMPNCKKAKIIAQIWKDAGAEIEYLNAKKHDEIYANISHYVQFLSHACAKYFPEDLGEFSRLMNSPREIWAEIFMFNKENIKKTNARFIKAFEQKVKTLKPARAKDKYHYAARIIAQTMQEITPKEHLKYAGTGYKSFTSIAKEANSGAVEVKLPEIKNILNKILNDLKKAKL